jgi:predicted LPLAT superfamily acyltransferase
MYSKKRAQPWTGKSRGGALGNGLMKMVLKFIGLRAGYLCLYFIVPYFYIFAPKARRSISQYWRAMETDTGWWWRQKQIFKHFYVFGQTLMDRGYQSYQEGLAFGVEREGPPIFDHVKQSERGWIFLGAHVGGWELSSMFMKRDADTAQLGGVHFVGQGMVFDPKTQKNRELTESEAAAQANENSLIMVKTLLDEKKHVGFLTDRAVGEQVELIPFLGKLAPFETRPFRIAAVCRAPRAYFYSFKRGERDYVFTATEHLETRYTPDKDRRQQIFEWTESYVRDLEIHMRRYPHQWFNFYPFWSSMPKQVPGAVTSARHENCLVEDLFNLPTQAETGPRFN